MGVRMGIRSQKGRGLSFKSAARADRARKAYELNLAGWTNHEISAELGVGYAIIDKDIKFWVKQTLMPLAEDVKKKQLDRLELLWKETYKKVLKGDIPAVNAALKILERQAKLLGLDITKVEFTQSTDPREIELIELINEAKAKMRAEEDRLRMGTLPPQ